LVDQLRQKMPSSFVVPKIASNPDGWGPNPADLPEKFKDIPYAPFSKSEKVGKAADWTASQYQNKGYQQRGGYNNYNQQPVETAFRYVHDVDEDTFQTVESRAAVKPAFRPYRRFQQKGVSALIRKDQQELRATGGRGRGGQQKGQYSNQNRNWNNRQQERPQRFKETSVDVGADWNVVDQVQFSQLQKLAHEVAEPEDIRQYGVLEFYEKTFDRVTTKTEKGLQRFENLAFHNVTTTDDPIIRQLAEQDVGNVFATDAILALLMCCTRSVFSWDIIAHRVGKKLFFDKREGSQIDFLTVNETAHDIPAEDKDGINSLSNLSQEATFINQNFSQQVLIKGGTTFDFPNPNPFAGEGEELASIAYRYRKWKLGNDLVLVARCELDGVMKHKDLDVFLTIKALNEYDPKISGVDWRQKLDSQRGAVLATELRNNSNKLARWTAQALLAGADQMKLGYVSRTHPGDSFNHVILGTQTYKPREFATQINLNVTNMWGILKVLCEVLMKLPEGKYVLLKDPLKPVIRVYEVPPETFDEAPAEEAGDRDAKDEGDDGADK